MNPRRTFFISPSRQPQPTKMVMERHHLLDRDHGHDHDRDQPIVIKEDSKVTYTRSDTKVKIGPEPTLISRKQVDTLYEILDATIKALAALNVEYIVTGGSLLGAIRQHSILFCDDDIDIAIIDDYDYGEADAAASDEYGSCNNNNNNNGNGNTISIPSVYETVVVPHLQSHLGNGFVYQVRPWEGGDRIRSKTKSNIFLDLFVLRRYNNFQQLQNQVLGIKKNGQSQPRSYIDTVTKKIQSSMRINDHCFKSDIGDEQQPFWHFSTRKAVEMWPKEVYLDHELFPLTKNLKFGPLANISGPRMPVVLLKRAFGDDCFDVYYQSVSHGKKNNDTEEKKTTRNGTQKSQQHDDKSSDNFQEPNKDDNQQSHSPSLSRFPPLVSAGGTWEGGRKVPLDEIHYVPMQPISRALRRPTMHCKQRLMEYLEKQTALEATYVDEYRRNVAQAASISNKVGVKLASLSSNKTNGRVQNDRGKRKNLTVYTDGVFDLFHGAHLKAIEKCAALGQRVIVGVTGDTDATSYKRKPIVPQEERSAIVKALSVVDDVVCPCPLIVTKEFMEEYQIDLVVHGFANESDLDKQREFFDYPMRVGKFQRIPYTHGVCTTDRIHSIQDMVGNMQSSKIHDKSTTGIKMDGETTSTVVENSDRTSSKPQWFGATLARINNFASEIPTDPFPLEYRLAIEIHIEKARKRRREALDAIRSATGQDFFDSELSNFKQTLGREGDVQIDEKIFQALIESFYKSTQLEPDVDLSRLHDYTASSGIEMKLQILRNITENRNHVRFQEVYDAFVRDVCVPHFVSLRGDSEIQPEEVYYQAFPCLRVIQPDEFSIGPHADVSYGHHPCSVNFYVPLTSIGGSSSLFLESRPGSEDWHCITQNLPVRRPDRTNKNDMLPTMKHFAGAVCLHWTTDNKTPRTRISLDFRLISASAFEKLKCGGHLPGGQLDVYRDAPGYYSKCTRTKDGDWERVGNLLSPDARVGFPWTVKSWDKFMKKHK